MRPALFAAIVVLVAAVISFPWVQRIIDVGAGFAAHRTCSAVFVSGRPDASQELRTFPLKYFSVDINEDTATVTSSLLGLTSRSASYRRGIGCSLVREEGALGGKDLSNIPTGGYPSWDPNDGKNVEASWPFGDAPIDNSEIEALGVNTSMLASSLSAVGGVPKPIHGGTNPTHARAVAIAYDGHLVYEAYAKGFHTDMRIGGWSMTKSITAMLVGRRIQEGKLSLEETGVAPEWRRPGDDRFNITLGQLMQAVSGLYFDERYGPLHDATQMLFHKNRDFATFAARKPLHKPPGTFWAYSSGTTNIISRRLRETFNKDDTAYWAYPGTSLFDRIGVRSMELETDPSGTFVGSSFASATARDWLRFGELLRRQGTWPTTPGGWFASGSSEQVLSQDFVRFLLTPGEASAGGYGGQVWLNQGLEHGGTKRWPSLPSDTFAFSGFEGQWVVGIPSRKVVAVRLGCTKPDSMFSVDAFVSSVLEWTPV